MRQVPYPDVFWNRLNAMSAQNSYSSIFFHSDLISKLNEIVYSNLETKSSQETQIFPKCIV